ncbi:MAG TPA: hypothetical protein VFB52_04825 [Solirubrobacterales bacterium]|nr:hypothetical protein [Solirubrobacterales bacterium]
MASAIALLAAITASVALAGAPVTGADGNSQAIDVKIGPKTLSKTKLTPATLEVTTKVTTSNPTGVPVPATRVVVDFDKTAKLFTKGLPTCTSAKLQNVSTEIAEQNCKSAIIGRGTASALLPVGSKIFPVAQEVTAFNGVPKGGKPVVYLHSYGTTPIQTTLVLTGVVSTYNKEGYGPRLDVEVPLIAGGAGALTDFNVKIDKKFRYKGEMRSFISAKCPNSKKLKARGAFTFKDGETITALSSQSCKQKK